jgi:hypothetical protein
MLRKRKARAIIPITALSLYIDFLCLPLSLQSPIIATYVSTYKNQQVLIFIEVFPMILNVNIDYLLKH